MKSYFLLTLVVSVANFACLRCHAASAECASNTVASGIPAQADVSTHKSNSDNVPAPDPPVDLPIKYWGNSSSAKFHKPSCPFARAMNSRHVVLFHFRRDAIAAGQQPCRYCLPPFVERVEGKLLPRPKSTEGDIPAASAKPEGKATITASREDPSITTIPGSVPEHIAEKVRSFSPESIVVSH